MMFKDAILNDLAESANVAQFVSFDPKVIQRFCRITGVPVNHTFASPIEAVEALLSNSPDKTVNVRSFRPDQAQGNPFFYGLNNTSEVIAHIMRLAKADFYTIVNETVDINDGGVSGVLQDGCIEFAPGVVPRFVEKHGDDQVPAMPRHLAEEMLKIVYGFAPDLGKYDDTNYRVEFSIHPGVRGYKRERTIIWEEERLETVPIEPYFVWPNPFSRLIGDKTYGLLLGCLLGAPVPRTTVFPRSPQICPFTFGFPTGATKRWTRTCPRQQEPGRFSTLRTWTDPFALMQKEDPQNQFLSACLVQDEVYSLFSGALITDVKHQPIIEGVQGFGDEFMLGKYEPALEIPQYILDDVRKLHTYLSEKLLSDIRFEWAHDGQQVWLLQLHKGTTESHGRIIVPGMPEEWVDFEVTLGLPMLHRVILQAKQNKLGIRVIGNVGMSSHIADLLRKSKIPSTMNAPTHSSNH